MDENEVARAELVEHVTFSTMVPSASTILSTHLAPVSPDSRTIFSQFLGLSYGFLMVVMIIVAKEIMNIDEVSIRNH